MCKRILSASVSIQEGTPPTEFHFHPGVNILCGQNAEEVLLTLAGIFGGIQRKQFEAVLDRQDGVTLFVSGEDGRVFADGIKAEPGDSAQFAKERAWKFRNTAHLLDGRQLPAGISGASDLLLKKLREALDQKDDRPLFVYNFLERLDEAVDLRAVLEALLATGRQIHIAVPHTYTIKILEEMPYDTAIHTL